MEAETLQEREAALLREFILQKLADLKGQRVGEVGRIEIKRRLIEAVGAYLETRINFEIKEDGTVVIHKAVH